MCIQSYTEYSILRLDTHHKMILGFQNHISPKLYIFLDSKILDLVLLSLWFCSIKKSKLTLSGDFLLVNWVLFTKNNTTAFSIIHPASHKCYYIDMLRLLPSDDIILAYQLPYSLATQIKLKSP